MGAWIVDIRHSLRGVARHPGVAAAAILSLALGIGVNTAVFSAVDTLLLRPVPVRDLDRTVYIFDSGPGDADRGSSFAGYERHRALTDTFTAVAATGGARPMSLIDGDRREQVYAEVVTADYFSIVDAAIRVGRAFDRSIDLVVDPPAAAILSDALWRRRFAADPAVVGSVVNLNGRAVVVIGICEPGFRGLDTEAAADLWIPMTTWAHLVGQPTRLTGAEHWVTILATLKDGVTIEQARAIVGATAAGTDSTPGQQTRVRPARERMTGSGGDALAIGGGAFAIGLLVLTLACTNVANLLLARAAERQREMAIRLALGGTRARLMRAWIADSFLLSIAGGVAGLFVAAWLLALVVAFKPPVLIGHAEAPTLPLASALDIRVFAFMLGLSALTALAVGLASGWQASDPRRMHDVKSGGMADRRFAPGLNIRSAIIALQMALSMLLLIPCGLMVRSWLNASSMDPGFPAERVLLLPISTDQAGVRVVKPDGFDEQIAARVRALPGVESATVTDPVPLWFARSAAYFAPDNGTQGPTRIELSVIGTRYFETLRLPLVRGRDFRSSDSATAPAVAIVNETLARRFWPGGDAIGQRLRRRDGVIEVVGVAKAARYVNLAEDDLPWVYLPISQVPTDNPSLSLAVRTSGDPMAMRAPIEREVRALVPAWPAFQFRTLDEGLALQRRVPGLGATVLGALGGLGLLLAAIGVYGVMAYVVKQRTREIGIRLALGSPAARVITLIIRQGMGVCATGAGIGFTAALAGTRFLSSVLYGVGATDPVTFVAVPSALLGVAVLACYLPARRLARLEALTALRAE
jgi:predicted permease